MPAGLGAFLLLWPRPPAASSVVACPELVMAPVARPLVSRAEPDPGLTSDAVAAPTLVGAPVPRRIVLPPAC